MVTGFKPDIRCGDVRDVLREMPDQSVQTVVTSPPYFGLRDYGTGRWEGGDSECSHIAAPHSSMRPSMSRATSQTFHGSMTTNHASETGTPYKDVCGKCGARRVDQQIGLESTPDAYVAQLVDVFREVRRVLKDDGTVWLNLGDSYAANRSYHVPDSKHVDVGNSKGMKASDFGAKPKDLLGIPWRVAFALQADGWYLRSDIIWHKPNPMPESVTDRPTKAHEYVFLLTKSERYYYDAKAIKEPAAYPKGPVNKRHNKYTEAYEAGDKRMRTKAGLLKIGPRDTRNKRTVWTVPTQPYRGAHFATMPEKLVEPCILAGSHEGDTVLDPFCGSGTVGVVALHHGRQFIGIELNPTYIDLAHARIAAGSRKLQEAA